MKATKILTLVGLVFVCALTSCSVSKIIPARTEICELTCSAAPENRYDGLTYGLMLNVSSLVSEDQIIDLSQLPNLDREIAGKTTWVFTPTITEFTRESMTTYIRSMGIDLGRTETSFAFNVKVREFKLVMSSNQIRATVILDYTLANYDNEIILRQTARGRYLDSSMDVGKAIDKAFSKALADVDWNSIASALRVNQRADLEPQREVRGNGDTALEQTIVRWYITSTPQGADVSWRIVSSTPGVKNSMSTWIGTTPYETTESYDIRGLSLDNSGNVQVEITCEKPGYITQKKRYNLRSAIDQREISMKFNLVKEE